MQNPEKHESGERIDNLWRMYGGGNEYDADSGVRTWNAPELHAPEEEQAQPVQIEVPTMTAEERSAMEAEQVRDDRPVVEGVFSKMNFGSGEKTPEVYEKFLRSLVDEHRIRKYSDEQVKQFVELYRAGHEGDVRAEEAAAGMGDFEDLGGDESKAEGLVVPGDAEEFEIYMKSGLENGFLEQLGKLLDESDLEQRVREKIDERVETEEEDVAETVRHNLFQKFMGMLVARKVIATATAVALAAGVAFAAFGTKGKAEEAPAAPQTTEAPAEPTVTPEPVAEEPEVAAPEEVSLWEDESLYQGNVRLDNKDLSALGNESYEGFLEEHPDAVQNEFGTLADYKDYERYDKKVSHNAVGTSVEEYHGDVEGMKTAILETQKENPQALAFSVASMPELLKQVGGMDEALEIEDAGKRAAKIAEMMSEEGGGDLQRRLYAAFELAVRNENTEVEFENISGPQWSSYVGQKEAMDKNTIENLKPGISAVTRDDDPHADFIMKFDKLDDEGNVIGGVTYRMAYREVCRNMDVMRVTYTEDDGMKEELVFTVVPETEPEEEVAPKSSSSSPKETEPSTPVETTEPETPVETVEAKNAENLQKNMEKDLAGEGVNNTQTITQVTETGNVVETPPPEDTTGNQTPVGVVTDSPEINYDVTYTESQGNNTAESTNTTESTDTTTTTTETTESTDATTQDTGGGGGGYSESDYDEAL